MGSLPDHDDAGDGRAKLAANLSSAQRAAEVLQTAERRLDAPAILIAGEVVLHACAPARMTGAVPAAS